MLKEHVAGISLDTLANYATTVALLCVAAVIWWPSRPSALRRPAARLFLERRLSHSDLNGIQTFPAISYIQISVTVAKSAVGCRAFLTKSEYEQSGNYTIEHNERVPLRWSKHGGANDYVADIRASEPPVRINVLVFNRKEIGIEGGATGGTPTNFYPLLQREGNHRLEVHVAGTSGNAEFHEICQLLVHWKKDEGAWVKML